MSSRDAIAGYEIVRKLGEGQSAVVYDARDTRNGRRVALKVLRQELLSFERARQHFHREARALSGVVHDNVIAVHDYSGKHGETLYIASERLAGRDLRALVEAHGALDSGVVAAIFAQAAAGLAAAHERGLVHRDLSLANIFVESSGRVVVMDFGLVASIAGERRSETFVTRGTGIVGTPLFLAPEVLSSARYDASSDVYALGVAATYCLLGHPPAPVEDVAKLLAAIIDGTLERCASSPAIDRELAALFDSLTARDPRHRPPSAKAVEQRLVSWLAAKRLGSPREIVARWLEPTAVVSEPQDEVAAALAAGDFAKALGIASEGRYEIRGVIGEGGMGRVFFATDTRLRREVAIKVMLDLDDAALAARFHREARAMGRLRHPNIVEVLDYSGPGRPLLFLVLAFVEGMTLHTIHDAGPAAPALVAAACHQLAEALAFVHDEGFIHRDLKPENVFVEESGRVLLGDFGIVRGVSAKAGETFASRGTAAVGSPLYSSPEQVFAPDTAGAPSDVFSLGSLMQALLTGAPPIRAGAVVDFLRKLEVGALEPLPDTVDPELRALIEAMHAQAPAERPPAAVVAQRLGAWLAARRLQDPRRVVADVLAAGPAQQELTRRASRTAIARASTTTRLAAKPSAPSRGAERRSRTPLVSAVVVALGLALGVGAVLYEPPPPAPVSADARLAVAPPPTTIATPEPSLPAPADAPVAVSPVAVSPAAPSVAKPTVARKGLPARAAAPEPEAAQPAPAEPAPAKPPAAEPLATGTLRVITKPWAKVILDGKVIGTTPIFNTTELAPGRYVVRLENPGFRPSQEVVEIKSGEARVVRVTLEKE